MRSPARKRIRRPLTLTVLILLAFEVHLDTALARVVDRLVPEGVEIERAAEFTVDARQQVEIERGGDTRGVVVGEHQLARVLLEVDADDQTASRRKHAPEYPQQSSRLHRREIADRGAGKKAGLMASRKIGRQSDRIGKIADDGPHVEGRKVRRQTRGCVLESAVRHIDRNVGAEPRQLPEQNLGLQAGAGAELDQHAAVRHAVDDLGGVRIENRSFGAGRIVLRQARDFLEQLAAARVVEEAARQSLARL